MSGNGVSTLTCTFARRAASDDMFGNTFGRRTRAIDLSVCCWLLEHILSRSYLLLMHWYPSCLGTLFSFYFGVHCCTWRFRKPWWTAHLGWHFLFMILRDLRNTDGMCWPVPRRLSIVAAINSFRSIKNNPLGVRDNLRLVGEGMDSWDTGDGYQSLLANPLTTSWKWEMVFSPARLQSWL